MKILVVDDNQSSAEAMSRILEKRGHAVTTLFGGGPAIEHLQSADVDLVFTDLRMEPTDGLEVLRVARSLPQPVEVVVFTAFGAVDQAVEAMRLGARDFLTKPISVQQILERVSDLEGVPSKTAALLEKTPCASSLDGILSALATVPSPVWIEGEVGSGRLAAARRLHELVNPDGAFRIVDSADLESWPSEGLVVLTHVDELTDDEQLRVARRVAAAPPGCRWISTANLGAASRVERGTLRPDLYFALAVVTVTVPPLRERRQELQQLFNNALTSYSRMFQRPMPHLEPALLERLEAHDWPGNLRELYNLAERTAVLGVAGFSLQSGAKVPPTGHVVFDENFRLSDHMEALERDILHQALEVADGDRNEAGRLLGVERNTLRYKLKKYDLL